MKICIISYGRADKVLTSEWLTRAEIVVPESQGEDYEEHNANPVVTIPDDRDGNVSRKRNAILDLYQDEDVVILDDDIHWVGHHERGEMIKVEEDIFWDFCKNMFQMAKEVGTVLWGVNLQSDKKFYREYSPFSLSSVVLGPWMGIRNIDEGLRFNEDIYLKEDYDFCLRVLNKYRKILRNNKWFYVSRHITNAGGLAGMRTSKEEKRQMKRFREIWGSDIVYSERKTQAGNQTINPVVRVPIKGI